MTALIAAWLAFGLIWILWSSGPRILKTLTQKDWLCALPLMVICGPFIAYAEIRYWVPKAHEDKWWPVISGIWK